MAIERSVSAGSHHRESLESSLGEVNEEDLPQTKDVDDGVRHGDPHASSKASVTSSSAECTEATTIVRLKLWTTQCCTSRNSQGKLT